MMCFLFRQRRLLSFLRLAAASRGLNFHKILELEDYAIKDDDDDDNDYHNR